MTDITQAKKPYQDIIKENAFLCISIVLLVLPWIMQFLSAIIDIPGQADGWITYPLFYWVSMACLIVSIVQRKLSGALPYKFINVIGVFIIQAFFGFHPLTPYPLILIIIFTIVYKLTIDRPKHQE